MEKSYKLKVNGAYEFELTLKDLDSLDIVKTGEASFHLLQEHKSFHIQTTQFDFENRRYHLKINTIDYEVVIETPLDNLIDKMGFVLNNSALVESIEAPMPGLILEVSIQEGQEVKENDQLLILEAMKMENVIVSPRDGVIKSISVTTGEAVEKKRTLITFE